VVKVRLLGPIGYAGGIVWEMVDWEYSNDYTAGRKLCRRKRPRVLSRCDVAGLRNGRLITYKRTKLTSTYNLVVATHSLIKEDVLNH
jgi:hypothetical protein